MADRPIPMSGPMVLAILTGRKHQTRRTMNTAVAKSVEPGDRLWVREAFRGARGYDDQSPLQFGNKPVWYEADGDPDPLTWAFLSDRVRPAMFMPQTLARIWLEVDAVRTERLQDITAEDAKEEGLAWVPPSWGVPGFDRSWHQDPVLAFRGLWDSIHKRGGNNTGYRWGNNPEVTVISFRRWA